MKFSHFSYYKFTSCIVLVSILLSSCATKKAVQLAVAESNEAIVAMFVDQPDLMRRDASLMKNPGWRAPVNELQKIIDNNPNNPILVNHLLARQAWVLTVYGQNNLADQVWNKVDPNNLHSERAANLYANRNSLTWWYARLNDPDLIFIEGNDESMARSYVTKLDSSASAINSIELKPYFATMSASISLVISSGAEPGEQSMVDAVTDLPKNLQKFMKAFSSEAIKCAGDSTLSNEEFTIITARNCSFLRTLYDAYVDQATLFNNEGQSITMPDLPSGD